MKEARPHPESTPAIQQRLLDLHLAFAAMVGQPEMTKAEFARRMGITSQTFRQITSENRVGIDTAITLCRNTGATLDWIYRDVASTLPAQLAEHVARVARSRQPIGLSKKSG